ncbi:MAG TPA: GNAT family N-acetyltransferase [Thermoplasmata archaeon]|nr:GNAT family N-acetyltransferase [Thermoplasmata archaeon]
MKRSTPPATESHPESRAAGAPVHVRPAREADLPALTPLIVRLKRLNEEFDPMLKVRPDVDEQAQSVLRSEIKNPKSLVLAAEGTGPDKGKIIGIVRASIRERPFYTPETEGVIIDIYLLPLYRRHGAGQYLVAHTIAELKERGAGIVTVEFPAQNEIADRFYAKCGFRPITAHDARIV